jgi:nitroreductase
MEEDLSAIIKKRRSVRAFKEDDIPQDVLEDIIESAIWAPSSCNRQPWHFVIVKKQNQKTGISLALASKGARKIITSAPAVIVVSIDMSRYWSLKGNLAPFLDAGVAIQNILLKAESLGVGTCTIAGHIDEDIVKKILNLPRGFRIMGFIPMGYPKKVPPPPKRREVSNYYSIDSFKSITESGRYYDVCSQRAKVSRSGGDVSGNYETPRERIPIFESVKDIISRDIKEGEQVLYTYSGLGFFLKSAPTNVQCLVFSQDEMWYLREVLGLKNSLIPITSFNELGTSTERYDRIISLFDIHFMDNKEITDFFNNLNSILKENGKIIVVFLNKESFYGLNYKLANRFDVNLETVRPCGYEHPLVIQEVSKLIPKDLKISGIKTSIFIPPPNIGYIFDKSPQIPYKTAKLNGLLGKMPFFKRRGSVVFLILGKST